ncbi:hypothetical protein CLV63_11220 [Murinocardiopsis flavida]|uniref:Uncharacterized protein n=1 Tax=Murinocardiopsis flavida TaxID=645275 RepID=A0A2P8DG06_9ACTN|nr:hypothetical protein [Murinocardiopsis flavida]PSK96138.1 hypothetical protein CLV63_11220 [Murinocardiopsis flavida]
MEGDWSPKKWLLTDAALPSRRDVAGAAPAPTPRSGFSLPIRAAAAVLLDHPGGIHASDIATKCDYNINYIRRALRHLEHLGAARSRRDGPTLLRWFPVATTEAFARGRAAVDTLTQPAIGTTTTEKIAEFLLHHPEGVSAIEVRNAVGTDNVSRRLVALCKQGRAERRNINLDSSRPRPDGTSGVRWFPTAATAAAPEERQEPRPDP